MWEHRCKVAVSGVGFSRVTRSAEVPLAAHALEAVQGAVADSGLAVSDIDGLATYPELPATGHAVVDGITIVSVNCMMAMLKLSNLSWHVQVETVNIGGAVQQAVNALLAGVCRYAVVWRAMHNPKGTYQNLPGTYAQGPSQFTAPYGFGGPGQGMAVAYTRWLERHGQSREKMATLAVTQRRHSHKNPHAYFCGQPLTREDYLSSRMVAYPFCLYDCDIPVSGIYGLESYGFCKEGEALDFIQDGRIELHGELPLNTFGGSLSTGRIHGLWHIIEGALQASGRAGERQVKDVNVAFVGASAPIVQGTTFIFVKEPY